MIVKIGKRDVELNFTFNSFKYMEDFDISAFAEAETKPFKILGMIQMLLMGAVNNNPKVKISEEEVQEYLENLIEEGQLSDLLEALMKLLEDSSFFKSLQKKTTKKQK